MSCSTEHLYHKDNVNRGLVDLVRALCNQCKLMTEPRREQAHSASCICTDTSLAIIALRVLRAELMNNGKIYSDSGVHLQHQQAYCILSLMLHHSA